MREWRDFAGLYIRNASTLPMNEAENEAARKGTSVLILLIFRANPHTGSDPYGY
ncbi:protein of unknown function [uncultured Woeseiaceae bacterium]|uniref:Uncharacterized protein n=1 Tax=uncultured Woeseiaceae bacterium TaxID=1983305 RepID=A0A7D9H7C9_9GAMM|nr:protein of unknown function [uncultured Woeseiaceae bacterium]